MKNIPGRILGVELLRPTKRNRSDGSSITMHPSDSPGSLSYGWTREFAIAAETGYTVQPNYNCKTPVETLVRCSVGEIFVVSVDLRSDSPTFGDWQGFYLQENDDRYLLLPPGVAYGWQVCSSEDLR